MKTIPPVLVVSLLFLANLCAQAADPKADFLKLINRPKVPLTPVVETLPTADGLERYHFTYASEAGVRVPGLLVKQAGNTRRPVVVVLHGTTESKDQYADLLTLLANKGFIAVATDGRFHGERKTYGAPGDQYSDNIARAFNGSGAHPFYYDNVWDVTRLLDYLETRSDVDSSRIGMTGISKGGIETYMTTAVDPRVKVAVPCIAMQSFRWELDNDSWQARISSVQRAFDQVVKQQGVKNPGPAFVRKFYDRVVPGIYGEFDGPSMITLIAPRPLLLINSDKDPLTPMGSLKVCIAAAEAAYRADHAGNRFDYIFQNSKEHLVSPKSFRSAIDWFVRWLKP